MRKAIEQLPAELVRSITWNQGTEMARHREFSLATGVPVYFCDPHSPCQRSLDTQQQSLATGVEREHQRCIIRCMNRTNIYLEEEQARSLDEAARAQGISRAALIRRLINRGLDQSDGDLESDLAAIEGSFNILAGEEEFLERGADERSAHLEKVRGGQ